MRKCRIGVVGVGRGYTMMDYCVKSGNAELVAVCDKWVEGLENTKKCFEGKNVSYFTDYDEFLKFDMDAVVLANYATEHAPFAIKAMEAGKNVISEVLPCQTMSEAVRLIECVERTGKIYCYAENYCYMNAPIIMRRKFLDGSLGEFEYGEGEYMHNCEPIWTDITYGEKEHWRNQMSAFFYCTHSVGPLLHIAGMRPVKVSGFEGTFNPRMARMGARAGGYAVEMVTLENGAILKSLHGVGPSKHSIWYSVYGSKGRIESAREDAGADGVGRVYENLDDVEGISEESVKNYIPEFENHDIAVTTGHFGSDFYCMYNAVERILGNAEADAIDVYEAVDMWMCGFFGFLSAFDGAAKEIPDLRDKAVRESFRADNRCTDPKVGGEQTLPSYTRGELEIPDAIYDARHREWEEKQKKQK